MEVNYIFFLLIDVVGFYYLVVCYFVCKINNCYFINGNYCMIVVNNKLWNFCIIVIFFKSFDSF